jgi:hypothetical protein
VVSIKTPWQPPTSISSSAARQLQRKSDTVTLALIDEVTKYEVVLAEGLGACGDFFVHYA